MKKIKLILTGILSFLIVILNVNAASASLSVSSSSIYSGESFTAYVNMNGAAAWNLHVAASGPVSGCKLDIADATLDALDTSKSFPVTCTSTGVGTITLTLSGDVTSAIDGNAVNVSGSASVTVTNKPAPTPTPTPTPTPSPKPLNPQPSKPTPSPKPSNPQPSKPTPSPVQPKSSDTTIQKFVIKEVENFNFSNSITEYDIKLDKVVEKLEIEISLNDKNANYEIKGNENLKIGDNEISVIVTAEDGTTKEFKIKLKIVDPNKERLSLKNITIKNYILNYYKNNYNYELKINNEKKLDIVIDKGNENIKYEIIGNEKLKNGSKIEIKITDGTDTESYFINIIKSKTPNIWLTCLLNVIIIALVVAVAVVLIRMKNNKNNNTLMN